MWRFVVGRWRVQQPFRYKGINLIKRWMRFGLLPSSWSMTAKPEHIALLKCLFLSISIEVLTSARSLSLYMHLGNKWNCAKKHFFLSHGQNRMKKRKRGKDVHPLFGMGWTWWQTRMNWELKEKSVWETLDSHMQDSEFHFIREVSVMGSQMSHF